MSHYTSIEALDADFEDKLSDLNKRYFDGSLNAVDRALAVGKLNEWYDQESDNIEALLDPEED